MTQSTASQFTLHHGNNIDVLKQYPDNHFDSVVTDPPYGIDFLGKDWDSHTGSIDTYKECLRVLKPGGHLLAFSAARTYHHLAMSVELAGFEIRDQIMWVYSSGFPKSQDVGRSIERANDKAKGKKPKKANITPPRAEGYVYGKGTTGFYPKCPNCEIDTRRCECGYREVEDEQAKVWSGWGTALKPAHEPIVVARKPAKLSIAKNVQVWGTGALNIDATRIEVLDEGWKGSHDTPGRKLGQYGDASGYSNVLPIHENGRFPSNVLGELPDYQKYFYCPKVSRKERHAGMGEVEPFKREKGGTENGSNGTQVLHKRDPQEFKGNNHPTVKPQLLMEYLIKLVTPPNGRVLDPFNGSGSTGMAAVKLGHQYTGIDLDEKYIEISAKRIEAWNQENNNFRTLFDETTK